MSTRTWKPPVASIVANPWTALEATGGFQVAVDTDASFRRMVEALARGIRG